MAMALPKSLSERGWKDVAAKNKVKDNGLQKSLEKLGKLDDDKHDDAQKLLGEASKLAQALKKDKAVAALNEVVKYLGELLDAAEDAERRVAKAKADHAKQQKAAQAAADKKKKEEDAEAAEGDEEEEETPELLTTKFKPLLKQVQKGEKMHTLVAKAGKKAVVMLSRKPIPPARRRMLAEQLGGGSTKYYPGQCTLEAGVVTFSLSAEVAGLTKLVKAALLQQTGLRVNKLKCRGDDGDDEDDEA